MKSVVVVVVVFLSFFGCNPLHAIWKKVGFEAEYANTRAFDYEQLSKYLYLHVDCHKTYADLQKSPVFSWIKDNAQRGNVVCLYFFVRNYLEKKIYYLPLDEIKYHNDDFNECLQSLMFCLQRVAYDVLHHYSIYQNQKVFVTYHIFKEKFRNLLETYYADKSLKSLTKPLVFWNKALTTYWDNATLIQLEKTCFPCRWVESFSWSHYMVLGTIGWGITFGAIPNGVKFFENDYLARAQKIKAAMITIHTTVWAPLYCDHYDNVTWGKFFSEEYFPLTVKLVEEHLQLKNI